MFTKIYQFLTKVNNFCLQNGFSPQAPLVKLVTNMRYLVQLAGLNQRHHSNSFGDREQGKGKPLAVVLFNPGQGGFRLIGIRWRIWGHIATVQSRAPISLQSPPPPLLHRLCTLSSRSYRFVQIV